ncbi:hypothetical protein PF004_g8287 [Phytophthora fragariae]|uniref:Uncharacterized protein n=1 Tax=Phytophthora fragariae TaxID=53985 RepID=A0A6G0P773_9STRA|nr:hypothetical protein PF004_g8287 [Phytophthora fragariae]
MDVLVLEFLRCVDFRGSGFYHPVQTVEAGVGGSDLINMMMKMASCMSAFNAASCARNMNMLPTCCATSHVLLPSYDSVKYFHMSVPVYLTITLWPSSIESDAMMICMFHLV